jgi:hypothetical protein
MPKVGNKHFPYTPEGYAMAEAEAQRTGLPVELPSGKKAMPRKKTAPPTKAPAKRGAK